VIKAVGGSGRGNKGSAVLDIPDRPNCPYCSGFVKSNGSHWKCTPCNAKFKKESRRNVLRRMEERESGFDEVAAEKHARKCEKGQRLIVTCAQHNTDVDGVFFQSLITASKFFKCQIACIPLHYKNITLMTKDKKQWVDEVSPYLVKTDINFNGLKVKSDARINATTRHPLSGKQAIGGNHWTVFGHTQVARIPVAAPGGQTPKVMFSTGAVTLANYSQSNDGLIADFHHTIGALIIERSGDLVFVRQINAGEDGTFYDLDKHFKPDGVTSKNRIKSIVTGDEHWKFNDCERETYGKGGIVDTLRPEYIVRHDVYDHYGASHHHSRDPVLQFAKHHNGDNDVKRELDQCIDAINRTTPKWSETLIVPSNHHDHLSRWLSNVDINSDHQNALLIAELQAETRKAAILGKNRDPFYLYASPRLTCKHRFLERNQSFLIGDVDHSQHGDVGVNGSRGSPRQLALTTYKMSIGHSHSPCIHMGVFQAGSSTGRLDYEKGLSTHSRAHIIQYQNGKRALIDIIDGRWRL